MKRVLQIALREWRENVRQRWLLATMSGLLVLIAAAVLFALGRIDPIVDDPSIAGQVKFWTDAFGVPVQDPAKDLPGLAISVLDYLVFSQLLGMTAVIAGHAGIHDRLCGTLPFLLLAPVRRWELLLGKVLGALSVPLVIYLVVGGTAAVLASTHSSAAGAPELLPPSPAWMLAFLIGGPVWSAFVGTLCVVISALSPDVRTAQQAAWFLVFFATMVVGPLLVNTLAYGPLLQVGVAGVGVFLTAVSIALGSWVIGRDLSR